MIKPGNLFIFYKQLPPFTDHNAYHMGVFVDNLNTVIHVTRAKGVVKEALSQAITDIKPSKIAIYQIQRLKEEDRKKAIKFQESVIGAKYNDIFSLDCINSKNQKSFYCTQLVVEAFGKHLFPIGELNFVDKDGNYLRLWAKHFEELKSPIPHGFPGYPLETLLQSNTLKMIQFFDVQNGKINEEKISSNIENQFSLNFDTRELSAHL